MGAIALGGVVVAFIAMALLFLDRKWVAVSEDSKVRILSVESGWGTQVTLTCGSKIEARIRRWLMKAGFPRVTQTEFTVPGVQPVFCVLVGFESDPPDREPSNRLTDRIALDGIELRASQWSFTTFGHGPRQFMILTSHQPEPVRTNRSLELRFTQTAPISIPLKPDVSPR